ncbi:MAG: hypothetical protein LUF87_03765 [Alistipes sp.]|nr:hypothetical protein [Alistipes sp.]
MKKIDAIIAVSALAMAITLLCSCSDDGDKPLEFLSDTYVATTGNTLYVDISSGNGKYTVMPEDEGIVTCGYEKLNNREFITLYGNREGKTSVAVTDRATGETAELTVYVTKPYCTMVATYRKTVIETDGNDSVDTRELEEKLRLESPFKSETGYMFHLVKNSRTVYIADYGTYYYTGEYDLVKEGDTYSLTVLFDQGGTTIEKQYSIGSDPYMGNGFELFDAFFTDESDSGMAIKTRTSYEAFFVAMIEDLTGKFSPQYPGLQYAGIESHMELIFNSRLDPKFLE